MSQISWGEQPSLLLDQVKEALDDSASLSIRLRVAARTAFAWRTVDLELAALPPSVRLQRNDNP